MVTFCKETGLAWYDFYPAPHAGFGREKQMYDMSWSQSPEYIQNILHLQSRLNATVPVVPGTDSFLVEFKNREGCTIIMSCSCVPVETVSRLWKEDDCVQFTYVRGFLGVLGG